MTDKSGHCEFVVSLTWQSPTLEKRDHHDAGVSFLQYAISFLFSGGIPLLRHSQNLAGNPPPSASFPKSSIGNPKVFCGTSPSPSPSPVKGEGKRKETIRGNSFPLILVDIFPPVFLFFCLSFFVYVVDRILCFRLFGGYRGFPPIVWSLV